MRNSALCARIMSVVTLGSVLMTPLASNAQSWLDQASHHRQQTKNTWRNIGTGSAALGLYGLLKHDNTLFFAGTAGALYSAQRYEHDRRSQSKIDRARAGYFGRSSYSHNGHRYVRKTIWQNGHKYYRFVRA